ncbi:redoxin family protein [Francisella philomiragia subsp. philomiragia ATCC 25015]|uniref:thioredoxin-dependent thiol peroxidase n=1 Tax=Francisella philomiragia TaxID=28110 RepID=UPI0001AF7B42|nr:thioredoxin-dependent thiol peroxidase [Francisella philomiragia]AJI75551.1 redoxin family protein [Francisella philomiragia subsp. philomiragia ATCC 25015]EET20615.1 bacterioferritin comigratory protein [Francisella philomiragia subsp. philomiragia ATCC 25015]MBK2237655.1 thioredoxin-dependent thiol peroxidase [Francisella philomiragia]
MKTLEQGQLAPNFKLENQNNEEVSLSDFKGKKNVLIYFYPKAMTPGCTTQSIGLSSISDKLAKLDTVVLGISPDAPKRLKKFEERDNLTIQLLSDEDHKVAEQFGVWGEKKFMGKVYDGIHRISFFIDKDGKINHVFNKFKTKDHHEVVLEYIENYKNS